MTCPACAEDFDPVVIVHGLTVCGRCGTSVVADTGRRATAADTTSLTTDELRQLRALRNRPKRDKV